MSSMMSCFTTKYGIGFGQPPASPAFAMCALAAARSNVCPGKSGRKPSMTGGKSCPVARNTPGFSFAHCSRSSAAATARRTSTLSKGGSSTFIASPHTVRNGVTARVAAQRGSERKLAMSGDDSSVTTSSAPLSSLKRWVSVGTPNSIVTPSR